MNKYYISNYLTNHISNYFCHGLLLLAVAFSALSAKTYATSSVDNSQFKQWQVQSSKSLTATPLSIQSISQVSSRVKQAKILTTDIEQLRYLLTSTSSKSTTPSQLSTKSTKPEINGSVVISLPLPSGELVDFRLSPSSVMATGLAEKYPQIKTFTGYQVNQPMNSGRFDITEHGFHGMFHFDGKVVFIEPQNQQSQSQYLSYYRHHAQLKEFERAITLHSPKKHPELASLLRSTQFQKTVLKTAEKTSSTTESHMTTYRLAISTSGEYSAFHGGTKSSVLSELVTLTNRLNDVYQRDLSVKLELVSNNAAVIFLDEASDPFNNNDQDGELNTNVIDGLIGSANYDVGHIVNTDGGGLAGLGVVCNSTYKGDGITGAPNPTNDAFYIDYVAHEIGHQFGGDHTFNGNEDNCEGNRESLLAFEPGSASTIMGYAGICGSQSLQNKSDPYFHAKSIEQINTYLTDSTGSRCGVDASEVNNIPVVTAGSDYTIPALTPFTLTGSATDGDATDSLTYSWQQIDLGTLSSSLAEMIDDGSRPLFRVWDPVAIPSRTLPQLSDILAVSTTIGETYATTDRALNFRLLVRDTRGGVGFDDSQITIVGNSEGFAVTAPSSGITWSSAQQVVSWHTANSQNSPVSCSKVDISLSTDGGNSFTTNLATQVANDGSFEVTVPEVKSSTSRVKITCSDNIFFAINGGDFTVDVKNDPVVPPVITDPEPEPEPKSSSSGSLYWLISLLMLIVGYRKVSINDAKK